MNILMSVLFWVLFIAYIFSAAVLVLVVLSSRAREAACRVW